jgi:hypothetical protein
MVHIQRLFVRLLGLAILTCLGVLWLIDGLFAALEFATGYGHPLGTYTGQEDDRSGAWESLAGFIVLSIAIAAGIWLNGKITRRTHNRPR